MDARQITTLMHKLFYGDIPHNDGWVHLMIDDALSHNKVNDLIEKYIKGDELLIFVDPQHCAYSNKSAAFEHIKTLIKYGVIRIADPRFHGRILINPIGVGTGNAL
ncbi:hypothetical protein [Ectopseudomonas mendocina]|uniref:hypothetical protein n=1 Tax=Ectopseudomonas mendocina TaxID=300 RepID=UPI0005AB7293|nr:hypothetical protein [Pseudomonas mendocina]VEE16534.1 Uncharacterised protein [Pseudomonas mendocina]